MERAGNTSREGTPQRSYHLKGHNDRLLGVPFVDRACRSSEHRVSDVRYVTPKTVERIVALLSFVAPVRHRMIIHKCVRIMMLDLCQ